MSESENVLPNKEDSGQKVYEVGYLLVPTLESENLPAAYGDLKELVTSKFHGEIISDEVPKMMNLAYTMQKVVSNVRSKFNTAYFGWTKFTMEPKEVLEFKKHLDLDPKVLRFLILKTVKENTIATRRFVHRDGLKREFVVKKNTEVSTPINKEEVDKEIDALITT